MDNITIVANMTRELMDRYSQGNIKDEDLPKHANEIIKKTRLALNPKIGQAGSQGQLMMDAFGNVAKVYPNGEVESSNG